MAERPDLSNLIPEKQKKSRGKSKRSTRHRKEKQEAAYGKAPKREVCGVGSKRKRRRRGLGILAAAVILAAIGIGCIAILACRFLYDPELTFCRIEMLLTAASTRQVA